MRFGLICIIVIAACGTPHHNDNGLPFDGAPACSMEGGHRCDGSTYQTCSAGTWQTAVDCPQACVENLGCVLCQPGETFCKDGNVWRCDDQGSPGEEVQVCTGQTICVGGGCADACADAATNKSYIACEYWAADVDNAIEVWGVLSAATCNTNYQGTVVTMPVCMKTQGPFTLTAGGCDPGWGSTECPSGYACSATSVCVSDAQHGKFGIVVSNPQAKDVHVTVTGPGGQTITQTIAAGAVSPILPQAGNAIPDQSIDRSTKTKNAYKIVADLPIVAYQFNPLDNSGNVFSNDASLLIPQTTFDTDYYAMSWPTLDRSAQPKDSYYGYITIVAARDNTQIAVTPTAPVQSSATQSSIAAGATVNFTLNAHDVVQLQAQKPAGDLTGTHIVSTNDTPFGVFGGHEAAAFGETTPPDNQHTRGPCCADHLEEMLFPSTTWGMTFAIARTKQRAAEPDYLRIVAQKPGTSLTFTPPPSATVAGDCSNLGPGQFCDVKIQVNTEITSTQPILVGHFIESAIWQASNGTFVGNGDPSLAIDTPSEQFRKDYTVPVPAAYDENYISIAAAATGGVTLDGQLVTLTQFTGGGTHRSAIVPVAAGQHTIHCADGCGVLVHGYSNSVSYMFAGGLDLKPIVIL